MRFQALWGRGGSDGTNAGSEIEGSRTISRKITHGAPALHPFWLAASTPSYVRKPLTPKLLLRMSSQTVPSLSHSRPSYAQQRCFVALIGGSFRALISVHPDIEHTRMHLRLWRNSYWTRVRTCVRIRILQDGPRPDIT
jgi:hypothetical protein